MQNPTKSFTISLKDLKKFSEAMDMLDWEKKITLQPDPDAARLAKETSKAVKEWELELKKKG